MASALFPLLSAVERFGKALACLALCGLVAACGFQLKGTSPLPFSTLHTNIPANTHLGAALQRALQASSPGLQFVADPAQAQVIVQQLAINEWLRELSLDAQGRVEEYELNLEFTFQAIDPQGRLILPPTTLRSTRELPYDDAQVQAKQGEIETVFRSMRQSLVERIVFLLSSPAVKAAYENPQSQPYQDTLTAPAQPRPDPAKPHLWGAPKVDSGLNGL
ncbi:MAG: LPS assembly lipoprotein LptE [Burkholderiaceae bacterium]